MSQNRLVAIPCTLLPGMFPSERVFKVTLANGEFYEGIAPRYFCWNSSGQLVAEDEITNGVDGKVAAKFVGTIDDEQVAAEVPDGEVLAVPAHDVVDRPTQIHPPGSKTHSGTAPHVSY